MPSIAISPRRALHRASSALLAIATIVTITAPALVPDAARAQDAEPEAEDAALAERRARDHFGAGRAYFEEGEYDRAAEQFERAYSYSSLPEMLVNASLSYERALRFDEAIDALDRILANHPDTPQRRVVEARRQHLVELRDRVSTGETAVDPAGTEPETSPEGDPATPSFREPRGGLPRSRVIAALVTGGVALGAGGAAIATFVMAKSAEDDLSRDCAAGCTAAEIDASGGPRRQNVARAMLALSGALTVTAVTLLVIPGGGDDDDTESARLRLDVAPTGLSLRGSF